MEVDSRRNKKDKTPTNSDDSEPEQQDEFTHEENEPDSADESYRESEASPDEGEELSEQGPTQRLSRGQRARRNKQARKVAAMGRGRGARNPGRGYAYQMPYGRGQVPPMYPPPMYPMYYPQPQYQQPVQPAPVQPPAQAPAPVDNRPVYNVNHALGAKQIEHLEKFSLPGKRVIVQNNAQPHAHPIAAIERRVAEEWIVGEARTYANNAVIVDIGGNPGRHATFQRADVWSCCPIITHNDAARIKKFERLARPFRWCQHTAQACNCVVPDVYIAIHSLYYLTKDDILNLLARASTHVMLACVHVFNGPRGRANAGELSWERRIFRDEMTVVTSVRGNNVPYRHDPLDWLRYGYFAVGDRAVSATELQRFGDTRIYLLTPTGVVPDAEIEPIDELARFTQNVDYYGEIKVSKSSTAGERFEEWAAMTLPTCTYWSFGDHLCFSYGRKVQTIVPKDVLADLVTFMTVKVRQTNSLTICAETAKRLLRDVQNMTSIEKSQAILPLIVLGYTINLTETVEALDSMHEEYGDVFEHMNQLMVVPAKRKWNVKWMLAIAAIIAGTWAARRMATTEQNAALASLDLSWVGKLVLSAVVLVMRPMRSFANLFRKQTVPTKVGKVQLAERYVELKEIDTVPAYGEAIEYPGYIYYDTYCPADKPLAPIREDAKIFVPTLACVSSFASVCVGIGFVDAKPIVPRSCVHSDEVAIRNRTLMPRSGTADAWRVLVKDLQEYAEQYYPTRCMREVKFDEWVKRFPMNRRSQVIEAKSKTRQLGLTHRQRTTAKAFVKRESLLKSISIDKIECDPRLIQGKDDAYLASVGPVLYNDSKYLADAWGYADGFGVITYAAGLNAQTIGQWYDDALNEIPSPVQGNNDASRWDGNLSAAALAFEHHCIIKRSSKWRQHKLPNKFLVLLRQQLYTRGETPHGVKYSCEGARNSGDANTSSGNSTINAHLHVAAFNLAFGRFPTPSEFRIIVMGDDSYLMITQTLVALYAKVLVETLTNCGIRFKLTFFGDPREAQFCSSRWWPTAHGHVLGPKPMRALPKTFYCRHALSEPHMLEWLSGVAVGWRLDANHVPIMRVAVAKILELNRSKVVLRDKVFRPRSERLEVADEEALIGMCEIIYPFGYAGVLAVEKLLREVIKLPAVLSNEFVESMVRADAEDATFNSFFKLATFETVNIFKTLWYPMTLGPIFEECFKMSKWGVAAIIGLELIQNNFSINYVSAAAMHLFTGLYLTPKFGVINSIVFHALYNWIIITCRAITVIGIENIQNDPGTSILDVLLFSFTVRDACEGIASFLQALGN